MNKKNAKQAEKRLNLFKNNQTLATDSLSIYSNKKWTTLKRTSTR